MTKKLSITTLKSAVSPLGKKLLIIGAATAGLLVAGALVFVSLNNSDDSDDTASE